MVQPLWKTFWQFLITLTIVLSYNLTITLHSNYPNELKIYVTQNPEHNVYYSLFTNAGIWKQPRYLTTSEWLNASWYIRTMEYFQ